MGSSATTSTPATSAATFCTTGFSFSNSSAATGTTSSFTAFAVPQTSTPASSSSQAQTTSSSFPFSPLLLLLLLLLLPSSATTTQASLVVALSSGTNTSVAAPVTERELEHMTEQIRSIIQSVYANQGGELEAIDGMSALDVVVRILDNQLSSLMWIDEKVEELSSRIQKLALQGSGTGHELMMAPEHWTS